MINSCVCQSKKQSNNISFHTIVFSTENENIFVLVDKNCIMFGCNVALKYR